MTLENYLTPILKYENFCYKSSQEINVFRFQTLKKGFKN